MSHLPPPSGPPLDTTPPRSPTPWWRRWWVAVVAVLVVALGVGGALSGTPDDPVAIEGGVPADEATTEAASPAPSATPSASASPTPTPRTASPSPRATATADPVARTRDGSARVVLTGTVVEVVDGDTIDLSDGSRIRLAIVDTPEVYGGAERCGREASAFTARRVRGEKVAIVRPAGVPQTDPYDRVLGEVIRQRDGWSLNVGLVEQGLGRIDERYADEDPALATRLREVRAEAREPECARVAAPRPAPEPEPEPQPQGGGQDCAPGYDPCIPPYPPDLDCGDVGQQVRVTGDDPHDLDGSDDDGLGCESH